MRRDELPPPRAREGSGGALGAIAHCAASLWIAVAARDVEKNLFQRAPAVARQQFCRRVVVLDAAALHDDDALAQPLDLGHVVRGEQHRGVALAAVAFEMAAHPVGGVGIERGRRLVEQQHVRIVDQRLGERDPRLLSGRKACRSGRSSRSVRSSSRRQFRDAFAHVLDAVEHAEHGQILAHREPHRHFDIRALEIHAVQNAVALLAAFRRRARSRGRMSAVTSPMMVAMVVVLPAPLPPSSPVIEPGFSVNEMPSTAGIGLVDFDEAFDGDRGRWRSRHRAHVARLAARGKRSAAEAVPALECGRRRWQKAGREDHIT